MNTENKLEENHECIFEPFKDIVKSWQDENEKRDPEARPKNNVIIIGAEIESENSEGYESHNTLMISGNLCILKDTIVEHAMDDDGIAAMIIEAGKEIMMKKLFRKLGE